MSDGNGIAKCVMCGGEPVFHARYNGSFAKCTVCGNGFEIMKSDFETPRASKEVKRDELIRMWNAKQDANERFLESNDWVKDRALEYAESERPVDYSAELEGLRQTISSLARIISDGNVALSESYKSTSCGIVDALATIHEDLIERLDGLKVDPEVPAEKSEDDPAQLHLDDFGEKARSEIPDAEETETALIPVQETETVVEERPMASVDPNPEPVTVREVLQNEEIREAFTEAYKVSEPEPGEVEAIREIQKPEPAPVENEAVKVAEPVFVTTSEPRPLVDGPFPEIAVTPVEDDFEEPVVVEEEPVVEVPAEEPAEAEKPKVNPLEGMTLDQIQFFLKDLLSKQ